MVGLRCVEGNAAWLRAMGTHAQRLRPA